MSLSNITIEKSDLSNGYYFGCVLSNISCFESDLSNTIFSNGEINNLFIKKSNIFGTSFTNTMIKICSVKILCLVDGPLNLSIST